MPSAFIQNPNFYVITKDGRREVEQPDLNTYALQADEFAAVVWGEKAPQFAPADAIANMKVIDACLQSIHERNRITITQEG